MKVSVMGCVSSKRNINNFHSNVYEVINVDEDGNKMSVGHLEVTESDLILHQKSKPPTVWPLKSLRRYGADSELFSFESGRRAPTGEGIFAFRCQRAEQLFNHLQAQFTAEENATQNAAARTPDSLEPSGYLEPTQPRNVVLRQRQWSSNGRMDSIHSSGPLSPPPVSSPPPGILSVPISSTPATPASTSDISPLGAVPLANEEAVESEDVECDDSNNNQHPYINYDIIEVVQLSSSKAESSQLISPCVPGAPSYMNVELRDNREVMSASSSDAISSAIGSDGHDSNGEVLGDHLYMNVVPGYENAPALPAEDRVPPEGVAIIAKPVSGVTLPFFPKASQSLTCGPLQRGRPLAKLIIGQDSEEDSEIIHPCYTNLSPSEREGLGFASTPVASVNYAVLDLNHQPSSPSSTLTPTAAQPDSPLASASRGYATIDFNKTEALSHSVNPNLMDVDHEGCRKTRHNSTISDLPTPVD